MARRMSFALTEPQLMAGEKDVTRRCGWANLVAGEWLIAIRKGMGLAKGEKQVTLCALQIIDVRREPLDVIDADECRREGFPQMTPAEFVAFFCKANSCKPSSIVTRIEFRSTASMRLHVLAHGQALCGMAGPPGIWAPPHRWISFEDPGAVHANCNRCATALVALNERTDKNDPSKSARRGPRSAVA